MKTIAELKTLSQWVGYTSNKVPMCPHTGGAASSNNPDTWGTAAQAWSAKKRYGWAGIGYVFTIGAGVVGVDLDDCFDSNGRLSDDARQIVQMLNSYTERSPSGKGLHILACGSIPNSVKRPGFEMYNELRYFTVTGNQYGEPRDIEDRQGELEALFAVYCDVDGTPPPQVSMSEIDPAKAGRYAQKALTNAMLTVSSSANGVRNHSLFKETASLVELVNAGALERGDVERAMTAAALASGLEPNETQKTIASAFKKVKKVRNIPPPRPRYIAIEDTV